jgi:hypothetical protein
MAQPRRFSADKMGLKKSLMTGRGVGDSHLRGSTSFHRRGRLPGASACAGREPWYPARSLRLPTWFSFFSGPVAVPRAGACRARCACICSARSVLPACAGTERSESVVSLHMQAVQRQEARKAGRTASRRLLQAGPAARGDRQSGERSWQAAFRSWEPTQAWDDHHFACGTWQTDVTAPRWQPEQGSSRCPAGGQAREPAAPRDADQLACRYASGCPGGFA